MPTPEQIGVTLIDNDCSAWDIGEAIREAIAAEREACARIAEMTPGDFERDTAGRTETMTRQGIAAAIRNRSN